MSITRGHSQAFALRVALFAASGVSETAFVAAARAVLYGPGHWHLAGFSCVRSVRVAAPMGNCGTVSRSLQGWVAEQVFC